MDAQRKQAWAPSQTPQARVRPPSFEHGQPISQQAPQRPLYADTQENMRPYGTIPFQQTTQIDPILYNQGPRVQPSQNPPIAPQTPPPLQNPIVKRPNRLVRFFEKPSTVAFFRRNRFGLFTALIGLIVALLFLTLGFLPTLLILIFVSGGYTVGSFFDRKPWVYRLLEALRRY